ncbi:MAG: histone H1 [Hyphomicrobiales bacterium]|nr:histone H1 [Hyphomicrobiales bacterium]
MTDKAKRPRDTNQLAKRIADIATGEVENHAPTPEEKGKDPAAVGLGRRGGLRGGLARSKALTKEQKKVIAQNAAKIRWAAKSD